MTTDDGGSSGGPVRNDRAERLAEALRANLRRRKAQARSRRSGAADERAGLPETGDSGEMVTTMPESGDEPSA